MLCFLILSTFSTNLNYIGLTWVNHERFCVSGADGSHIVGGRDSAPHSRPYMASLQIQGRPNCGGVLVREDFVLTAAHCAVPLYETDLKTCILCFENGHVFSHLPSIVISSQYTVVVGVNSLSGNEATKQELTAVRSFPHPNYDGHANDIMLLKLNSKVQLTEAVQLIALKTGRINVATQCLTVGWGDIGDNNTLARTLQEVNVTTLSQPVCRLRWRGVPITRTMICGIGSHSFQGFCSVRKYTGWTLI
uniref:trypsin n=1 Tax=Lates calcarifer TaxID=8187 RepID=A0A4W6BYY8_LATCA